MEEAKAQTIEAGNYILIYEGAVLEGWNGEALRVANEPGTDHLVHAAENANAVVALGSCAVNGGWMGANPNSAGALGVQQYLKKQGIDTPVINIPGCPPHPDWIVGTIGLGLQALATNTLGLLVKQGLDANGRPKAFYKNVHMNCPHLSAFEAGHMVKTMSDKDGCRFSMGCKGPRSACDSFERKWNNGVNWCVNNATCIGCTSPTFPDGQSPFYVN